MVTRDPCNRRGGMLGCLVSLLLFAGAAYYGVHIGEVYWRYYEVVDAMKFQARLAATLTDREIQNRLSWKADSLIPGVSPDFSVRRTGRPGRVIIETSYNERVVLPFFDHTFRLRPRADAPL